MLLSPSYVQFGSLSSLNSPNLLTVEKKWNFYSIQKIFPILLALYKINNLLRETISNHSSVLWNVKVQHEHKVLFSGNNTNSIKQQQPQKKHMIKVNVIENKLLISLINSIFYCI